jgi:hypothetical protein
MCIEFIMFSLLQLDVTQNISNTVVKCVKTKISKVIHVNMFDKFLILFNFAIISLKKSLKLNIFPPVD